MDEIDALRQMRTTLAREESPNRLALRLNWRSPGRDPRRSPRARIRRRLAVPLLGAAAAGAVAAGSVAVLSGHADPRQPGRSVPLRPGGDGNVLLTAATSAEKATTGAYWHTRRISGTIYAVGRTRAGHYKVESREQYDSWVGRDGREVRNYTDLPARPWTAQDEAKWRRAGSPMTVRIPTADGPGVLFLNPKDPVGVPHPRPMKGDEVRRFHGMTPAQIAGLPTEPKALEKALLALRGDWHAYSSAAVEERLGALRGEERVRALSDVAGDLLADAPTPPKVRAAAFRMLATLPGIQAGGTAADPLGRTGTVISLPLETTVPLGIYTAPKQLGTYRRQWIIDPGTGTLLAVRDLVATPPHGSRRLPPGDDGRPRTLRVQDMPDRFHRPGEVSSYAVYAVAEWTNAKPGPVAPR